jgi:hypothetical protein
VGENSGGGGGAELRQGWRRKKVGRDLVVKAEKFRGLEIN